MPPLLSGVILLATRTSRCGQQTVAFSVTLADVLFEKAVATVDACLQNYTVVIDHTPNRAVQYYGALEIAKRWEPH